MPRVMLILGLVVAAILGAGAVLLFNMLMPQPVPVLRPAWQIFPMTAQTPVPACKDGFARAFRAAGFINVTTGAPDGLHVQASDNGYAAVGICMPRREAAAVLITGIDAAVVDTRLDTVGALIMGRAVPPPARPR